jgi:hypothetical protein
VRRSGRMSRATSTPARGSQLCSTPSDASSSNAGVARRTGSSFWESGEGWGCRGALQASLHASHRVTVGRFISGKSFSPMYTQSHHRFPNVPRRRAQRQGVGALCEGGVSWHRFLIFLLHGRSSSSWHANVHAAGHSHTCAADYRSWRHHAASCACIRAPFQGGNENKVSSCPGFVLALTRPFAAA